MSDPWRRHKNELRKAYYDLYDTHEKRILHVPPNVKEDDWIKLCNNENDEKVQKSRLDYKRNTSDRKPHILVKADLVMENPGVGITTSDVWIKTHTQEGYKILPCA